MQCRICLDENDATESVKELEMMVPCKCSGTSKHVHRKCIESWLQMTESTDARIQCMECRGKYKFLHDTQHLLVMAKCLFVCVKSGLFKFIVTMYLVLDVCVFVFNADSYSYIAHLTYSHANEEIPRVVIYVVFLISIVTFHFAMGMLSRKDGNLLQYLKNIVFLTYLIPMGIIVALIYLLVFNLAIHVGILLLCISYAYFIWRMYNIAENIKQTK